MSEKHPHKHLSVKKRAAINWLLNGQPDEMFYQRTADDFFRTLNDASAHEENKKDLPGVQRFRASDFEGDTELLKEAQTLIDAWRKTIPADQIIAKEAATSNIVVQTDPAIGQLLADQAEVIAKLKAELDSRVIATPAAQPAEQEETQTKAKTK